MSDQFGQFIASEIYCPKCGRAQPVRERLLLVLPSGELYEYFCARCSASLAKRTVTATLPDSAPTSSRASPGGGSKPHPTRLIGL